LRVGAPQLAPDAYLLWVQLATACWFICFAVLAWRVVPMLLQPRIDGREH
ncbi:MAG: NnrS family protein, partial [Rhodocyclaceae bacterium]|nr:NnrS family protein [Rhodocyclaceae bacterium]